MHIGINAQLLSFSQNYRNGGVSRYIRFLLKELARQPEKHEYTVFVNGQEIIEKLSAQHPQITYVPATWSESQPAARVAWEQVTLPSLLRQKHIDVLHSPVNVLPVFLPRSCAGVVTLHDLAFIRLPNVLTPSKRLYHQMFTVRSIRQATMVIAVSESTKEDAVELMGVPAERVQTVYPCIDARFSIVSEHEELRTFREKQGLTDGYILYLGTLEPRKNITTLIEAYARLRKTHAIRAICRIRGRCRTGPVVWRRLCFCVPLALRRFRHTCRGSAGMCCTGRDFECFQLARGRSWRGDMYRPTECGRHGYSNTQSPDRPDISAEV